MAEYIPEVSWDDFKTIVEQGNLGELKSCEVNVGGKVFTAIIGHGDMHTNSFVSLQAEQIAVRSNIVGGKDPSELLTKTYKCKECSEVFPDPLSLARHSKMHKKELVNA